MSRAAGRAALAALRPVSTGPTLFGSRASNSRGTLPPGRQDHGLVAIPLRLPAQLLPLPLGGRAPSAAAGAGTPETLARTVLGLGARICWRSVPRGLAFSGGGGGRGIHPGELTTLIKGCRDAAGLLKLVEEHGKSFNFIHVGAAWGRLAKMRDAGGTRVAEGEVIKRLELLTGATVQEMGAWGVSNIIHSMATVSESGRMAADDELTGTLLARAEATAAGFNSHDISNVLWALATMGIKPGPGLLEAMQRRATATENDFKPQGVANVLWALATMGITADARLLEAMQGRATATAGDFKPQGVANVLWALATMGITADARLLEAMQARATATARDFKPQSVANVMWALATMGIEPEPRLLDAMQRQATAMAGKFKPQEVANVLRALACFDTSPSQESVRMVESLAVRLLSMREQLSVGDKSQLHQWLLFCELHPGWRGQLPMSMQNVKEEHGGSSREAFALEAPATSRLQANVAKQLRRLFPELKVEEEYEDARSGYRIDIRAEMSGRENASDTGSGAGRVWAVEVDGPTHFLQGGSGREPSKGTLLKRRQLEQLGYTAVAVPYWEWNDLEGKGEEELRRYLQAKLRIDQVSQAPPSSP
ncbi:hypothetical protein T484DRAFT_1940176 [Baffinella frigidus]|nr:hypothetical protein T484DRAFT_1940176 [Cryptophyta sp. CCMP2293]